MKRSASTLYAHVIIYCKGQKDLENRNKTWRDKATAQPHMHKVLGLSPSTAQNQAWQYKPIVQPWGGRSKSSVSGSASATWWDGGQTGLQDPVTKTKQESGKVNRNSEISEYVIGMPNGTAPALRRPHSCSSENSRAQGHTLVIPVLRCWGSGTESTLPQTKQAENKNWIPTIQQFHV